LCLIAIRTVITGPLYHSSPNAYGLIAARQGGLVILGGLDRLSDDLGVLDKEIAQAVSKEPAVKRLLTITGVNLSLLPA
jgi:hypothetical protein